MMPAAEWIFHRCFLLFNKDKKESAWRSG